LTSVAYRATDPLPSKALHQRLTVASVAAFACPAGKARDYLWCGELRGFGIIARPSARRVWIVQYRHGRQSRRVTLGDVNAIPLPEAREKAREILAKAQLGADPQAEKRAARAAVTVREAVEGYLEHARARLRKIEAGSGPTAANRFRSSVSALWAWAMSTGAIATAVSPILSIPNGRGTRRAGAGAD
jgi:hypothetical protein